MEKLNQPIIKIISHKKNNNHKVSGSEHNVLSNINLNFVLKYDNINNNNVMLFILIYILYYILILTYLES